MSAGSFVLTTYEDNDNVVHAIKVQPEVVATLFGGDDNDPAIGPVTSGFAAEVNRGARAYGLKPRKLRVEFTTEPPDGYRPYTTVEIPVLQKGTWIGAKVDDEVLYSGGVGKVKSKIDESLRPGASVIGLESAQVADPTPE